MTDTDRRISRRTVLKGAAVGAGTMALAGCGADVYDGPGVYASRVQKVPDDPDHSAWRSAPEQTIELGPQDLVLPQKLTAAVPKMRVRALHDGERIGFRLEWDDPDVNDLTIRVDDFRDACAVLLLPAGADQALRPMGSATTPATLLHWKADWQRDVDHGRQGLEAVYPNRSIDVYPIVWNVPPDEVDVESYVDAGASEWLPGVYVGNPVSAAQRTTPVEKAIAYGFSTTTTAPTQDAYGRGIRTSSGWRVVITKPLTAADDGEAAIPTGSVATCAFAVWSGNAHDAGSRKSPAKTLHVLTLAG
ncbi:MAG TPA: ethylbenzene dehydrogenase-related protein [Ilumatobacteraceae bacterium]|nr:ethylbenzene dehydrogenase-related protein [Ilumatobacteraceae bacterium]